MNFPPEGLKKHKRHSFETIVSDYHLKVTAFFPKEINLIFIIQFFPSKFECFIVELTCYWRTDLFLRKAKYAHKEDSKCFLSK